MNYSSKVYYKVRQLFLLQSATAILLQSVTSVTTKCDRYYKVRQVLQSLTEQCPAKKFRFLFFLSNSQFLVKSKMAAKMVDASDDLTDPNGAAPRNISLIL